jgi:hypothetical protein
MVQEDCTTLVQYEKRAIIPGYWVDEANMHLIYA